MIACFYQKYWHIVGQDISNILLDFLNNGSPLSAINHMNVVLILKVQSPSTLKEFWPISLCNVIYKIVSKVLVNRLKNILPELIDDS